MKSDINSSINKKRFWAGRVLSYLAILFLLFDTILKVAQMQEAMDGTIQLGYPAETVFPIGLIELICLVLYIIPRTSIFGAILFTGYLGGAVATHVRLENPLFSHILFPIYIGLLIWGGLYLRYDLLREIIPFRRSEQLT